MLRILVLPHKPVRCGLCLKTIQKTRSRPNLLQRNSILSTPLTAHAVQFTTPTNTLSFPSLPTHGVTQAGVCFILENSNHTLKNKQFWCACFSFFLGAQQSHASPTCKPKPTCSGCHVDNNKAAPIKPPLPSHTVRHFAPHWHIATWPLAHACHLTIQCFVCCLTAHWYQRTQC